MAQWLAMSHAILDEISSFNGFGAQTQTEVRDGITFYTNEFWTAKQRQAHPLHEISYRACFKPQLPAFFIDRLTKPGELVYDPFMGRGTTLLEASLKGRIPLGNDSNPLAKALTEPRLNTPSLAEVKQRLATLDWSSFTEIHYPELLVFYHPTTLAQLEGLRSWLLGKDESQGLDKIDMWIRMVAINRLSGHSSGFFSVYSLPPNQAVSAERQALINKQRGQVPPSRDVPALILKKSKSLLAAGGQVTKDYRLITGRSDKSDAIENESVSLTVTSPPFLDIVNYEADNWLRCWFLGIDPKSVKISFLRKLDDWTEFTHATLQELARITKKGGHIAYEVGEVRKGKIQLEHSVIEAANGLPFDILGVMINQQDFTKTANCWGVHNNQRGTNSNRILLLRRM